MLAHSNQHGVALVEGNRQKERALPAGNKDTVSFPLEQILADCRRSPWSTLKLVLERAPGAVVTESNNM